MTVVTEGNSSAGEMFSIICTVVTEEGVRSDDISITWTGPDGNTISGDYEHIVILGPNTEDTVTSGTLIFFPLHTSDRGQYTCTGRILVTDVGVDVSNITSVDITVSSKYCTSHYRTQCV